jgi:hypothetical protein
MTAGTPLAAHESFGIVAVPGTVSLGARRRFPVQCNPYWL